MAFPTDWGRRCALVIQSDYVTDSENNFPMLVATASLPSEIFDADGSYPALNGGGDIRFSSDEAGSTQLACEIEQFVTDNDPANGKAAIWVKVPSMSSSSNTTIYIWYHKSGESQPAETDTYGKHAVWDSNFKMVQHMNQDPSGSAPQMIDSTSNSNDGTSAGTMTSVDQVAGQIDGSLNFDGVDDYVSVGDSDSLDIANAITVSAWIKKDANTDYAGIIEKGQGDSHEGYLLREWTDEIQFRIISGGDTHSATTLGAVSIEEWHYVVGLYDKERVSIYIDNIKTEGEAYSGEIGTNNINLLLGYDVYASARKFNGLMDEIRISNASRSAGWIETEYNNQYAPATFLIEGTPETPSTGTDVYCTLAMSNTLAHSAQANAGASLTLTQIATVADAGQANASATTTLADILGISESAVAIALATLTLTQTAAITESAQATAEATTTLSQIAAITQSATATAEATLTLGAGVSISTGATAVTEASLSLANILAVTQNIGQGIDVDLTLATTLSITEAAIAAAQATLALAHYQTLTPSAAATAGASLSLAQILTIAQITGQDIDVDLSLAQSLGITEAAQAVAGAALTLPKIVGLSQSAAATAAASISLAYQAALTVESGGTVSATLALAMQQGISATVTLDYNAAIALAQNIGIAQSAQANAEASLELNHTLALVLLAQSLAQAGLTLSAIQSITQTATSVIIGLVTPEGRTVVIAFENRTTVIAAEDRTVVIPSAN